MKFAQPIVFHRVFWLTTLAVWPVGQQPEQLVLRLSRGKLLPLPQRLRRPRARSADAGRPPERVLSTRLAVAEHLTQHRMHYGGT